jgi:hypothetical protein
MANLGAPPDTTTLLATVNEDAVPSAGLGLTGSTSGTTTLVASAVASGTLTLPAATDTLVGKATTDTLTNKTLTAPVLGAATATSINGVAITAAAGATITATAGQTYTLPTTTATLARTDAANTFTGVQTMVAPNITGTIAGAGFTAAAVVVTTLNGNTITAGTSTLTLAGSAQTFTSPAATDTLVGRASTDTLTNKTLTAPAINGAIYGNDISRCTSAQTANANTTYASVTGLLQTVVAGTYRFRCVLPSTVASGSGGIKYAFHYVTTAVSTLEATGIGYTASAVAVQHTTTTTDVADLFSQAAVVIMTIIEGTMVVGTGGTIQLQMAQSASNASNSITLVGASMEFDRIS